MEPAILIISTLDTKAQETFYLRDQIRALGGRALTMDLSMGAAAEEQGDILPDEVALQGGTTIEAVRASRDRTAITRDMTQGAVKIARELLEEGRLAGVIGLGGATLSMIATNIMRALPFGVPKVMVSSSAALPGLSTRYIGTGDIMLFHTVIELSGLSPHLKNVLNRAARAVWAMAQEPRFSAEAAKGSAQKQIALSMFGPCDPCAHLVQDGLTQAGFQVIGFHAAGVCDRAMEEMLAAGLFRRRGGSGPRRGGRTAPGRHAGRRAEAAGGGRKNGNPAGDRSQRGEFHESQPEELQAGLRPAAKIRSG